MKTGLFNINRIFLIIPLKIKIAIVLILGFALCISTLLYISLSKLTDIYKKTYQSNLHGSLASASFLLKNYQDDLDQSANRVVSHQAFLDIFKEEDPDLLAILLQELLVSEPLDLGYIVRIQDKRAHLWARSHNLNVISPDLQQRFDRAIWDKVESSLTANQGMPTGFHGYLTLDKQFLEMDAPNKDVHQKELVYVRALPIIIWNEWRGVAIFGTMIQRSNALKERLAEILGISMDNDVAFQVRFQQENYLTIGHPTVLSKLDQKPKHSDLDQVQTRLDPYPLEMVLYSDRYSLTQEIQNKVFFILSLIVFISCCFLTVLIVFLSKILGSLDDLVTTSKLMKKGVYTARMTIKSEDELGMLANHFNEMAQSIQDKVQTIKEQSNREKLLKKIQHETELSHLKNQMKPHFLFNTLHMIASLIEMDQEAATEATYLLADLYRLILQSSKTPTSSLKCELDILENYLEIQRMRFGDRLDYCIEVDLPTESIYAPQLTLQTLVENAVKHGIEKSIDGGKITIKIAQITTDLYEAQVINTGSLPKQDIIERTGLVNTRLMLKHLYGDNASFNFDSSHPGLVIASFKFSGVKL